MHDAPYFFNPDERNMAIAVSRFMLPAKITGILPCLISEFRAHKTYPDCSLNPHFFAYGQFPLYLAFTSDQVQSAILNIFKGDNLALTTNFPSAIYWLRFYSALASVGTVYLVYQISRKLLNSSYPALIAAFTSFSPGLIQSAHFGTTESLLSFFFLLVIYFSINLSENLSAKNKSKKSLPILSSVWKNILFISISLGLALGSKLTAIFFILPVFIVIMSSLLKSTREKRIKWPVFILGLIFPGKKLLELFSLSLLLGIFTVFFFIASSPYNLVSPDSFRSAVFGYESDVATGKYEAFYTRQFYNSKPFLFQAEKVFPYSLGWPVFILGVSGFLFLLLKLRDVKYFLLFSTFLIYLIPNSLLFAKWSRFMTPILPFFAVFAGLALFNLNKFIPKKFQMPLTVFFFLSAIIPGAAFLSVYINDDTRVTASKWIYENIPDKSYILSETANVIDIPLGIANYRLPPNYSLNVISFDFYHLDENPELYRQLIGHLANADYIFIPSRRIFKNHPLQPDKFNLVTKYYELLFEGLLGFEKQAEIDSFPEINLLFTKFRFPDEDAEETFTVFDHPVVRIYKKVKPLTANEYHLLFQQQPLI